MSNLSEMKMGQTGRPADYVNRVVWFMLLVVLVLGVVSCAKAEDEWRHEVIRLEVDSLDPEKIGYFDSDGHGPDFTVQALLLRDSYVYLVDGPHNNIKQIDLASQLMRVVANVCDSIGMGPYDMAYLNSHYYVCCWMRFVAVFSDDFELVNMLSPSMGNDFIFSHQGPDSIVLFDNLNGDFYSIYSPDSVGLSGDGDAGWRHPDDSTYVVRGKPFTISEVHPPHLIRTPSYVLEVEQPFPEIWGRIDAINVDYNDSTFVYADVTPERCLLHIYKRGW